jgi:hypothetical protein
MNAIIQRLKSKTYLTALAMAAVSIIEVNSKFLTQYLPPEYSGYAVMVWPVLMVTLREVTTGALSDK